MIKEDFLKNYTELISSGSTPKGGNKVYLKEGEILFFRGQNILMNRFSDHDSVYISNEIHNRMKRTWVKKGDVLLVITGSIGRTAVYEGKDYKANVNQHVCIIRLRDSNVLDPYYLSYFMANPDMQRHILRISIGATRPALNFSQIGKFKIPIPLIETQKKIVEILEKAEKLKEWRVEADELADEYLKSVFLEMFGTPVRNEKGWEMTDFKEIASIDKKSIKAELISENSNYIGLEHLESGTGKILEISSAKKAGLKSNKYLFDDECVLYGKLRPYLNKVALPNFEGVCSTDIIPIRPKEDKSNRYFIKYLLSLDYYIKKSTEQSTGANLPRISPKALESFKVYAPPINLQNQFAQIVQQVETLKTHQAQSKQEIDNLFNTLMQKAFKGELVC